MMFFRLVLASAVLIPVLAWHVGVDQAVADVRGTGWKAFAVGSSTPPSVRPHRLGREVCDSGVAAIANATVPIFVVLLALRFNPSERVGGVRLAGILVGLAGVECSPDFTRRARMVGGRRDARHRRRLPRTRAPSIVQHNYSQTAPLDRHGRAEPLR